MCVDTYMTYKSHRLHILGNSNMEWITEPFSDCSRGIVSLLKNSEEDLYSSNTLIPIKLKEQICHILSVCCIATNRPDFDEKLNWSHIINNMIDCLTNLHIKNIGSLGIY